MLTSDIVYNGKRSTILEFMVQYGITIIKPPDEQAIAVEYKHIQCFMVSSLRSMVTQDYGASLPEEYNTYRDNVFSQGEFAVNEFLVGKPTDEVAVMLNKFALVLDEDRTAIDYLFPFYEIVEILTKEI